MDAPVQPSEARDPALLSENTVITAEAAATTVENVFESLIAPAVSGPALPLGNSDSAGVAAHSRPLEIDAQSVPHHIMNPAVYPQQPVYFQYVPMPQAGNLQHGAQQQMPIMLPYSMPFGIQMASGGMIMHNPMMQVFQAGGAPGVGLMQLNAGTVPQLSTVPRGMPPRGMGVPLRRRGGLIAAPGSLRAVARPHAPGLDDALIAALTQAHGIEHKEPIESVLPTPSPVQQLLPAAAPEAAPLSAAEVSSEEWVQCDACSKWRLVPANVDMQSISSGAWSCSMAFWNPDLQNHGCSVPAGVDGSMEDGAGGTEAFDGGNQRLALFARQAHDKSKKDKPRGPKGVSTKFGVLMSAAGVVSGPPAKKKRRQKTEVQWVQCDSCHKWRKLAPGVVSTDELPDVWNCNMTWWDPTRAFCDAPEEGADESEVVADGPQGTDEATSTSFLPQSNAGRWDSAPDDEKPSDVGGPAEGNVATPAGEPQSLLRKRRRLDSSMQVVAKQQSSQQNVVPTWNERTAPRATVLPVPGTIAAEYPAAAYPISERKSILPPAYVHGHKDYHHLMLLHPPEVWGDPKAARGIVAEQIRSAWSAAMAAGTSMSVPSGQHAKITYRELITASWGSRNRGATQLGERSVTARESHLRWCRSSVYTAPQEALQVAVVGSVSDIDRQAASARQSSAVMHAKSACQQTAYVSARKTGACCSATQSAVRHISPASAFHQLHMLFSQHNNPSSEAAAAFFSFARCSNLERLEASQSARAAVEPMLSLGFYTARDLCNATCSGDSVSLPNVSSFDVVSAALAEGGRWTASSRTLDDVAQRRKDVETSQETSKTRRDQILAELKEQIQAQRLAENQDPDAPLPEILDTEVDPALLAELEEEAARDTADKKMGQSNPAQAGFLRKLAYSSYSDFAVEERRVVTALIACLLGSHCTVSTRMAHGGEHFESAGVTASAAAGFCQRVLASTAQESLFSSTIKTQGLGELACEMRLRSLVIPGLVTENAAECPGTFELSQKFVHDIIPLLCDPESSAEPDLAAVLQTCSITDVLDCIRILLVESQLANSTPTAPALLPLRLSKPWRTQAIVL